MTFEFSEMRGELSEMRGELSEIRASIESLTYAINSNFSVVERRLRRLETHVGFDKVD